MCGLIKELLLTLPYLGKLSLQTRSRISKLVRANLPSCKINFVFRSTLKMSHFFQFKDKICKELKSGVVYKFSCGRCNSTYIGKTKRHLKVRASEHMGISPLTGKRVNAPYQFSTVKDHMLTCDHVISFDDFSVIGNSDKNYLLEIKESLFIRRDNPVLNRNIASVPLFLYN